MEEKMISMQDELLRPAEKELEACIELLIRKMIDGNYDSGTAALKLTIELEETQVIDHRTGEAHEGLTPIIKYKATYGVRETVGVAGAVRNDRKVIERNDDGRIYFCTCEKAQKSLF